MKKLALILCGVGLMVAIHGTTWAQTITNQPQSVTVNNASTAEFTVGATNATNYQWQFNGVDLTNGANILGATNSALTLEDVNSNQMGNYSVVINNSVTSSNASLTVVPGTVVRFTLTGFLAGGSNTVDVQLFDHDKPATVENFLHYVNSGGYTNMFFDRCVTGFVLQGGDFGASNRTATSGPLTGWNIFNRFTTASPSPSPPFPHQVDSEFNVGPLIHNRFGTVAMAKLGSQPDSASTAFFFSLNDNSANLDGQNGGFTVFGRILNGTNVLQYFNGLTNGEIDTSVGFITDGGAISLGDLPLDYIGTNVPANSNLVFCDFSFPDGAPPEDTNPPTVAVTSIPFGTIETNVTPVLQGTASDDIGLADIICISAPQAAPDGAYANGGVSITNYAFGTTNWASGLGYTVTNGGLLFTNPLPPGSYQVAVESQDGAGNLSQPTNVSVVKTIVNIVGDGAVTYSNLDAVGYPFQTGLAYQLSATPGTNEVFAGWTAPSLTVFDSSFVWLIPGTSVLAATFVSNTLPNSIAFTYPPANGFVGTNGFNITGTISNVPSPPVTVTCQVVSRSTFTLVGSPLTNVGTTNWSVAMTNLPLDKYTVQAIAVDQAGNTTVIVEDFTVTTNTSFLLNVVGPGTVSGISNNQPVPVSSPFQATAVPDAGALFYTWTFGNFVSINPVFTNLVTAGLPLTATFVSNTLPNSLAFTAPLANVVLSNSSVVISGTLSNIPSPPVNLTCQLFSQSNFLAVTPVLTTVGTTNWSFTQNNLVAGNYIAVVLATDQASNSTIISENFTATIDTNLPTISITSPMPGAIFSDNIAINASGTAADSVVPLVGVGCFLYPQTAADGKSANGGNYIFDNAVGTSNWSVNFGAVPPGVYTLDAAALDTAGNLGHHTQLLTNTGVFINGNGTVTLSQGTNVLPNPFGYPLQSNVIYKLTATPGAGQMFVSWASGAFTTTNPVQTFTMSPTLLWTATFAPSNTAKQISFTYPPANGRLSTNNFVIKGRLTPGFKLAQVSCRLSSLTTTFAAGPLQAVSTSTTWSAAVTNLPSDNYVVTAEATNGLGQTATISERFSILAFSQVAGTYTGLFISTNTPVSPTNSGSLTFSVAASGLLTGKLTFPAYTPIPIFPLLLQNSYFIDGVAQFGLTDFHHDSWSATIFLDLSGSNDAAFGTISSSNWSSQVLCYRSVTKLAVDSSPAPDKYTFSISPAGMTNGATTNGYASLSVAKSGVLTLSGALPDNTTFSESTRVSKEGYWPVCVVPSGESGGRGLLLGWETFTNLNNSSGDLFWSKVAHVGAYYTNAIGLSSNAFVSLIGTNFVRPIANSQYSIIFDGGTIATPLTNSLTVNRAGQFSITGGAADKLAISLSAAGVLTGTLFNPADNKTLHFKGSFISATQGGSGFIPDANGEIGTFQLLPVP